MTQLFRPSPRRPFALLLVLLLTFGALPALGGADEAKPMGPFDKLAPESIEDLKTMQAQVKAILAKVMPCTVGVVVGSAQGSGVIISKDGYVLTAAHVSGAPNKDITLILQDGKRIKAKTLGANKGMDSGLIKIAQDGEWPFCEMGNSADLKPGTWCIATGHPGGYKQGRTPVVRVGRLVNNGRAGLTSDCTLVGGDSGGPLFDVNGKVIGIHSRIGGAITANVHVPIDTFRDTWDRLVKAETWGGLPGFPTTGNEPFLGVQGDPEARDCTIGQVVKDSPAEKAGLKVNDIIRKFEGQRIEKFEDLGNLVRKKKPGDEIQLEIARGEELLKLKVVLGRRGD